MGWEHRDLVDRIAVRLDAHGGEKERRHEILAQELEAELKGAILAVLRKPKYAEILLFDAEYYEGNL